MRSLSALLNALSCSSICSVKKSHNTVASIGSPLSFAAFNINCPISTKDYTRAFVISFIFISRAVRKVLSINRSRLVGSSKPFLQHGTKVFRGGGFKMPPSFRKSTEIVERPLGSLTPTVSEVVYECLLQVKGSSNYSSSIPDQYTLVIPRAPPSAPICGGDSGGV